MFSAENNEVRGLKFVEALGMGRGVTAVIGSGGKSSLLNRLAMELRGGRSERMGRSALASLWMMGGCALLP